MSYVDFEKIKVEFKCPKCGDSVAVDLDDILHKDNPWCDECDIVFVVHGSTADLPYGTTLISRDDLISIITRNGELDMGESNCQEIVDKYFYPHK